MEEPISAPWRPFPALYVVFGEIHNGAKLANVGTSVGLETNHWGLLNVNRQGLATLYELNQENKSIDLICKPWNNDVKRNFHTKWWLGCTSKTYDEIFAITERLREKYRRYNVIWRNCQGFVLDLIAALDPWWSPPEAPRSRMRMGTPPGLVATLRGNKPIRKG